MKEFFQLAAAILVLPLTIGGLVAFLNLYPNYEMRHFNKGE